MALLRRGIRGLTSAHATPPSGGMSTHTLMQTREVIGQLLEEPQDCELDLFHAGQSFCVDHDAMGAVSTEKSTSRSIRFPVVCMANRRTEPCSSFRIAFTSTSTL